MNMFHLRLDSSSWCLLLIVTITQFLGREADGLICVTPVILKTVNFVLAVKLVIEAVYCHKSHFISEVDSPRFSIFEKFKFLRSN